MDASAKITTLLGIIFFISAVWCPSEASISSLFHYHASPDSSSSRSNELQPFNITQDLFLNTANTGFNASEWLCLNSSHSSNFDPISPQCKCYVNYKCEIQETEDGNKTVKQDLWFRCYELTESAVIERSFTSLATKKFFEVFNRNVPRHCLNEELDHISLRADFVECNETASAVIGHLKDVFQLEHVKLISLTISKSGVEQLPYMLFENAFDLVTLNLSRNSLVDFDSNYFFGEESRELTTIDLSHCNLLRLDLSRFPALRSIQLSHNSLSSLVPSDFHEELVRSLENFKSSTSLPYIELNLANNPWTCDQELNWLIEYISTIVNTNGRIFQDKAESGNNQLELFQSDEPECNTPSSAKMFPFSVWKSVQEVSICKTCECSLRAKYAEVGYRYVMVNCTDRNLNYLPIDLPKNAKIFDLTNNQIRNLNPLSKSRTKLSLWRHVNKVILRNNSLEMLDGLDQMRSIVYLDISGNLLTEIPYHILNQVLANKLDKILIGNNPFTCDCNTLKMQKWLQTNYRIILDIGAVRCGYMRTELTKNESNIAAQVYNDRFYNREILQIKSIHLCPSIGSVELFDIINCILAFIIIFLLFKVTYDYFWQRRTGKLPQFFKLNI